MIVIWEWFNFDQDFVIGQIDNKIDEKSLFLHNYLTNGLIYLVDIISM